MNLHNITPTTSHFHVRKPGLGLGLLACLFVFFLVVMSVVLPFLGRVIPRPEVAVRIGTVLQDLLLFIVPAVGTAVVITRLPAKLLEVDRMPSSSMFMLGVCTLLVSIPAMNLIVEWNQGLHLPASMSGLEEQIRAMEDSAQGAVDLLLGGRGVGSLIVAVLIVGVLAGFSEEIFFRGALQRLLGMTSLNRHAAVWLTAFIFSLFHFQMFGFVPRLLLGAFFGYALLWSGSLWLPIILHALNNSVVAAVTWSHQGAEPEGLSLDTVGSSPSEIPVAVVSAVLVGMGLWLMWRQRAGSRGARKGC